MTSEQAEQREAIDRYAWVARTECANGHVHFVRAVIESYFGSAYSFCETCDESTIDQQLFVPVDTQEGPTQIKQAAFKVAAEMAEKADAIAHDACGDNCRGCMATENLYLELRKKTGE